MFKRVIIAGALALLLPSWAAAQGSPIKVTIFSSDSAAKTQDVKETQNTPNFYKNLIKWNYTLLGRGMFLLNYERHLANNFTLEIGAGVTYSDFIFTTFYEAKNDFHATTQASNSPGGAFVTTRVVQTLGDNSTKKFGFGAEISPRFYFDKDEFQGFYLSPYMSYRKYNYACSVEEIDANGYSTTRAFDNLYYTFLDLGAKVGYQYYFTYRESFYYDFYAGVAYRNAQINTVMQTDTQNNVYGYGITTTYSEYMQKMALPQFMLGAKIGYSF